MADLVIVPATLFPSTQITPIRGVAAAAITAGQVVCVNADSTIGLADANGTPPVNLPAGVAICSAAGPGQSILYVSTDPNFTIGATVVSGKIYCLSGNPGGICLEADLAAGMATSIIGVGNGTTKLWLAVLPSGQII